MTPPWVLIVAGEKSGDNYGAALVRRFRETGPPRRFFGIGGSAMEAEGVECLFPMEDLALMGLVEIVAHLPRLRRMLRRLKAEVRNRKPQAAVLIDSPDFNLRLAKRLKKSGIPVLYYISPTVWAWRRGRLKAIRKSVTRMMLIFPFEREIYDQAGIPATFVGHPLLERLGPTRSRAEFFAGLELDPLRPLVVLMPGSRRGEVSSHLPVLCRALPSIERESGAQFVLIRAEDLDEEFLKSRIPAGGPPIRIIDRGAYDAVAAADLVLSACGTANLEAALLGAPLVAFYRLSPLTYLLGTKLIRIRQFSIVNILAGKPLVPELIQRGFTPEALTAEALKLLRSPGERERLKAEFAKIREDLGTAPASENAAAQLRAMLEGETAGRS
jgi:lipid-A-disaccharide synthase